MNPKILLVFLATTLGGCVSVEEHRQTTATYGQIAAATGNSVQVCSWSISRAGALADEYCRSKARAAELVGKVGRCRPGEGYDTADRVYLASGNAPTLHNYRCVAEF